MRLNDEVKAQLYEPWLAPGDRLCPLPCQGHADSTDHLVAA
jgi:hypothetical protein